MNIVFVALSLLFILIAIDCLIKPAYLPLLNKNMELKLVATAEQNSNSLCNNVRITHITVNGKDINLGKVDVPEQSLWKYDSKHDFLYAYELTRTSELNISLSAVHSLAITFVGEVGSGYVETYLDDNLWFEKDLYIDAEWEEIHEKMDTSIWVFPEKHIVIWVPFLLIAVVIAALILRFSPHINIIYIRAKEIVTNTFLAIIIVQTALLIQFHRINSVSWYCKSQPLLFLKSVVLVFLLLEIILFVTGKEWIAFLSVSGIISVALIVSNIKLDNRGVPLLPWDFRMFFEAVSVLPNYEINISMIEILLGSLLVLLTIILGLLSFRKKNIISFRTRLSIALTYTVCTGIYLFTGFIKTSIEENNVEYRVYQVSNYYESRGFIPAFLEYMAYLDTSDQPEGYSKTTIEEIVQSVSNDQRIHSTEVDKTPNIVAIMSESFWDASRIDTITIGEELLPKYNELKSEALYGNLYTHVLNGGTVVSEFEFLTGFSGEFFPVDYMVYGKHINTGFESAVSLLERQGYSTIAFHPYIASNYNREDAYEKLGFDRCLFEEEFDSADTVRNYVSDQALFERMIYEYDKHQTISDQPVFMFAVTMQNHGGYWEDTIYNEQEISFTSNNYDDVAVGCIADMLAGLHESDRALGDFIDYFRDKDEETIIIYFGDHVSDAGPKDDRVLEQTSWAEDDELYNYATHIVPFLVWSNYELISEDLGIMEVGQLLPIVFDKYRIKGNLFWKFLLDLKKRYAATGNTLIISNDLTYEDISMMTAEQKEYYQFFKLLQYDYIWGQKYALSMWK